MVEFSARVLPPVGNVIPVFLKRHCVDNCGLSSNQLSRQQVAALNEAGQYVQAISVDAAVAQAGGPHQLIEALGVGESSADTITRESHFDYQNASQGLFALFALPSAIGKAAYLAARPAGEIEKIRLNQVSIPECGPRGCPAGVSLYYLRHDPVIGGDQGWVFFPIGKYRHIRAVYVWQAHFFGQEDETQTIVAAWSDSATSVDPPRTAEPLSRDSTADDLRESER